MIFIPLTLVPYNPSPNYGSSSSYYGSLPSFGGYSGGAGGAATIPVAVAPPEPAPTPPLQVIYIAVHNIGSLSPNDDGTTYVCVHANSYQVTQSKDEILGLIDAMYRGAHVG